jgi:uncharacterized membrane protein
MLHLMHPVVVHFAVAFLVVGGVWEAWALFRGLADAARFGERLVWIGLISLLPTLFTGYIAANTLDLPPASRQLLEVHDRNGWLVLGAFVLLQFWRSWSPDEMSPAERRLYAVGLLLAVALTIYNAMLGGEMVYLHGVGVGVAAG